MSNPALDAIVVMDKLHCAPGGLDTLFSLLAGQQLDNILRGIGGSILGMALRDFSCTCGIGRDGNRLQWQETRLF